MKQNPFETILVIVIGLIAVYWFRRVQGWLIAALLIGLVSVLIPAVASVIHRAWMRMSLLMGMVSGRLLLTLVYILVLIPLSFFARRLGKLGLRKTPGGDTYFKERNHTYNKEDLIHPW